MTAQVQTVDLVAVKAELRRLRQYLWGRAADAQAAGEQIMEIAPQEYSEFAKTITKAIACMEILTASQDKTELQAQVDAAIKQMVQNAAAKQSATAPIATPVAAKPA